MILDTKKMHTDILKRLNSINKPQRYLTEKLGVSRTTFYRLSKGDKYELKMNTFLKLIEWMEKDASDYIKNTLEDDRKNYSLHRTK